jgi:hypothetical protein
MDTNKVKLEFTMPKADDVVYNGVTIKVVPFLSLAQQLYLINTYIKDYFESPEENIVEMSEYSYLNAECNLRNYILQICTNIDVEGLNNDFYADTIFWGLITGKISNYFDFLNKLNFVISEIKQQEAIKNSVGKVLFDLAAKATSMMEEISKVSPEQIKELQKTGEDLMKRLENTPKIGQ